MIKALEAKFEDMERNMKLVQQENVELRAKVDSIEGRQKEVIKRNPLPTTPENQPSARAKQHASAVKPSPPHADPHPLVPKATSPNQAATNSPLPLEPPSGQAAEIPSSPDTSPNQAASNRPPTPKPPSNQAAASNPTFPNTPLLRLPPEGSATTLIIGDSNTKKVDPHRFDRSGKTAIRSVPGLTIDKLSTVLDATQPRPDIQNVVCHVGTNNLSIQKDLNTAIIQKMSTLIQSLKSAFPEANIGITGLIPRKGILLKSILALNQSLASLCVSKGVSLIGDKSMFLATIESFPRHLFLGDKVHLNEKGVGVLVTSIKSYLSPNRKVRTPNVRKVIQHDTPPRPVDPPPPQQSRQLEALSGQSRSRVRPSQASDQPSDFLAGTQQAGGDEPGLSGRCPAGVTNVQPHAQVSTVITPPSIDPPIAPPNPRANPFATHSIAPSHTVQPNQMFMFNPANLPYQFMGMSPFMHPPQGGPFPHPRYFLVQ